MYSSKTLDYSTHLTSQKNLKNRLLGRKLEGIHIKPLRDAKALQFPAAARILL